MATTFVMLRTEFFARGYDYMNDGGAQLTRAKAWVNDAYLELCDEELWPFLRATAAGAAPLAIADVRLVDTVVNTITGWPIYRTPEDELIDAYGTLTQTGTPTAWYLDDTTLRTYPVGGTLSVRYWRVPAALVADADAVVIPDRFANAIVDGAVRLAANDNNEPAAAQEAEGERQGVLERMREQLLVRETRHYQRITAGSLDA